jgi:hypothetical protein
MATRRKTKNADSGNSLSKDKKKVEREMSRVGLNYRKVAGIILVLIGIVLVVLNLTGVLLAAVGLILIYFGLKIFGYTIKI